MGNTQKSQTNMNQVGSWFHLLILRYMWAIFAIASFYWIWSHFFSCGRQSFLLQPGIHIAENLMQTTPGDILNNMLTVIYRGQQQMTMCGSGKGGHL